jgi:uncharacterized protein (UPF0332 family)
MAAVLGLAEDKLKSARILLDAGQWRDAASRAYYSAFHAASAVLLSKGLSFSSHAQTIGAFNRNFVKTGIFPIEFGRRLTKMQTDRESGDYRATSPIGEATAREDVAIADEFLQSCRRYLEQMPASDNQKAKP